MRSMAHLHVTLIYSTVVLAVMLRSAMPEPSSDRTPAVATGKVNQDQVHKLSLVVLGIAAMAEAVCAACYACRV